MASGENKMNIFSDLRTYSRRWIKEFIETYKSEVCLWQTKHPDYNNVVLRNRAYDKLIEKLKEVESNPNRSMVVRKINSLRSAFRREYRKKCLKENYEPRLWYYDMLAFIADQGPPSSGSPSSGTRASGGGSTKAGSSGRKKSSQLKVELMETDIQDDDNLVVQQQDDQQQEETESEEHHHHHHHHQQEYEEPQVCLETDEIRLSIKNEKNVKLLHVSSETSPTPSGSILEDVADETHQFLKFQTPNENQASYQQQQQHSSSQHHQQQQHQHQQAQQMTHHASVSLAPQTITINQIPATITATGGPAVTTAGQAVQMQIQKQEGFEGQIDKDSHLKPLSFYKQECFPVINSSILKHEDEFDAVGTNVASKLRSMNQTQRIIAEKLISDVIFSGQLDSLTVSSKLVL